MVLLVLTTGQRIQTLVFINITNIVRRSDYFEIKIPDRLKTFSVSRIQPTLIIPFHPHEKLLCPASTLQYYLERSAALRGSEQMLFVSFKKPHKVVTT